MCIRDRQTWDSITLDDLDRLVVMLVILSVVYLLCMGGSFVRASKFIKKGGGFLVVYLCVPGGIYMWSIDRLCYGLKGGTGSGCLRVFPV